MFYNECIYLMFCYYDIAMSYIYLQTWKLSKRSKEQLLLLETDNWRRRVEHLDLTINDYKYDL